MTIKEKLKFATGAVLAFFGKDEAEPTDAVLRKDESEPTDAVLRKGRCGPTDWEQKGSKHPTWQEAMKAGDL